MERGNEQRRERNRVNVNQMSRCSLSDDLHSTAVSYLTEKLYIFRWVLWKGTGKYMESCLYTPLQQEAHTESREFLCKEYFFAGYTNSEIRNILDSKHGISVSVRHLRRILNGMGCYRRKTPNLGKVVTAVQVELNGSGSNLGYRGLKTRLLSKYGLNVPRDLVSDAQRCLDPQGVAQRRNRRLQRRAYTNDGPNYLVHIDGFDKLKRYGFAIHGGIDGFSRRVLWLKVGASNNKPEIVAGYFVEYLKEIKGVPRRIRYDAGTENTLIEDVQISLRSDHSDDMAGGRSVVMGPSPSNQRIERFWRSSREGGGQFWIDLFKDLETEGHIDVENPQCIECLRFCFTQLIQEELDYQRMDWNQHSIRKNSNSESLSGKPDMLYFLPEIKGSIDYKTPVQQTDLERLFSEFCEVPNPKGCSPQFALRCEQLMAQHGKTGASDHDKALDLHVWLMGVV